MEIAEKVFMITGGTGQFGQVLCRFLLEKGAFIATHYRSPEKKQALLRLIPETLYDNLFLSDEDVTHFEGMTGWFEQVRKRFPAVHGAVHTLGGIHPKQSVAEMTLETWNQSIHLNLTSAFLLARTVLPYFLEKRSGKLIFVSALAGLKGEGRKAAYSVSKSGLIRLAETISAETKRHNVQTNVVLPSILKTPANLRWGKEEEISRWVEPENLAAVIAFLLSKAADAVTGATIPVTGGF